MIQSLDRHELLRLLTCAHRASERDWLMLLVGFWHGLRASEVVQLSADDIQDGHIAVSRLKGSNHTIHPLVSDPEPLLSEVPALSDYARKRANNQCLFPITRQHLWRIFQTHARAAEIPAHKRHPHVLKHSIAMQTIHLAGIENVRQYLGHKSISSTGAYLKVSDSDAAAAIQLAIKS